MGIWDALLACGRHAACPNTPILAATACDCARCVACREMRSKTLTCPSLHTPSVPSPWPCSHCWCIAQPTPPPPPPATHTPLTPLALPCLLPPRSVSAALEAFQDMRQRGAGRLGRDPSTVRDMLGRREAPDRLLQQVGEVWGGGVEV
jgi:hypothetical protein